MVHTGRPWSQNHFVPTRPRLAAAEGRLRETALRSPVAPEVGVRIHGLQAENFMRLSVVNVQFDGSPVLRVVGHNDQGKTSLIEAIASALGGEKLAPKVPIRRGAESAEVTVDLGEFIATRR